MSRQKPSRQPASWRIGPVALLLAAGPISACAEMTAPAAATYQPASLSSPDATGVKTVVLTDEAVHRIDLATATVTASGRQTVVPYAAVIYDSAGGTWVYAVIGPRTYRRAAVRVASVQGGYARLTAGPPVGTTVVTTGVTQVYGTEIGMAAKH